MEKGLLKTNKQLYCWTVEYMHTHVDYNQLEPLYHWKSLLV